MLCYWRLIYNVKHKQIKPCSNSPQGRLVRKKKSKLLENRRRTNFSKKMHSSEGAVACCVANRTQELAISGEKILKKTAAMGASQPQQRPK
jgi:hypothetical protein